MLYVQQSLSADEDLIHVGEYHWMHTVKAVMSIIWGAAGSVLIVAAATRMYIELGKFPPQINFVEALPYLHPGLRILSLVAFLVGLLSFTQMMIAKATTEIAITNRRLIFKQGLFSRRVGEMAIDRIEGVGVMQSFFGRMFGYGRLIIRGMGVGEVVLPPIENPLAFRRAVEDARRLSEEQGGI